MKALRYGHIIVFAGLVTILVLTVSGNFDYGHGLGNLGYFYLNICFVGIHFLILLFSWKQLQEWIVFSSVFLFFLLLSFVFLLYAFFEH